MNPLPLLHNSHIQIPALNRPATAGCTVSLARAFRQIPKSRPVISPDAQPAWQTEDCYAADRVQDRA